MGLKGLFGDEIPTGSLHGVVTDANGDPLEGVSISLFGEERTYDGMTDKNGKYIIIELPDGTYDILAMKTGYEPAVISRLSIADRQEYEQSISMKPFGNLSANVSVNNITNVTNVTNVSSTCGLHGTVTNLNKTPVEGVSVSLIGSVSNYSERTDKGGKYNFSGVPAGTYSVVMEKQGYRNVSTDITLAAGRIYTWNATIARDCAYYSVYTSVNHTLRYGYNGTVYRGHINYTLRYPKGASYSSDPDPSGGLSEISVVYRSEDRMLKWKLDNSAGLYPYVQGHIYIDTNGTQTMRLFDNGEMSISDAAASQSTFLGREISDASTGRTMIDPSNIEIKAIADQVKSETDSDDAWTVAKAMFVWLKSNTAYYQGSGSGAYTQSAIEMLHSRRGDCDELSYLYISLCRAAGIPARLVRGYVVERGPQSYQSHMWVEFYDGDWVPVEVADSGKANMAKEVDLNFGIDQPNHVTVFVDDGKSESVNFDNAVGLYYDHPPSFSPSIYYDAVGYDPMYIASCADGTRELTKEMS